MYKAAKVFLFGSTVAAGTSVAYNHYVDGDKSQDVANHLINAANLTTTTQATSELNKNIPPDPGWVRGQEKHAKDALDGAQAAITQAIQETMPDGSGDNKGGKFKGGLIGAAAAVVAGTTRIIMEATNPNPSKDAAEAHQEKAEEKQKQVPQDTQRNPSLMEQFFNWLNN